MRYGAPSWVVRKQLAEKCVAGDMDQHREPARKGTEAGLPGLEASIAEMKHYAGKHGVWRPMLSADLMPFGDILLSSLTWF